MMMKKCVANFLVWTMVALISSGAFGQTYIPPAAAQSPQLFVWTEAAPSASELDKLLAKTKALIEVDANYVQAEADLHEIWIMSTTSQRFEGQREALVRVALTRANLYKRLGETAKAVRATQDVLLQKIDFEPYFVDMTKFTLAGPDMKQLATRAVNDPRLVELRAKLERASDADSLKQIVLHAFQRENYDLIFEIGEPAQRSFIDLIVAESGLMPAVVNQDPLYHLIRINEQRAAELILQHLDAGGYLWKRRIIRAMDAVGVIHNEGTWSNERPYVCLEPEWLSVLEALLATPQTALQCAHMLQEPFCRDQFSPGLQAALVRGIENYELDFINVLLQAIDVGGVVESAKPVFEALAKHPAPQVKRFAARALTNYDSSSTLRNLADDADPIVRAAVALSLKPRQGSWIYRDRSNGHWRTRTQSRECKPNIDEEARGLLARFAEDEDAKIRKVAAAALFTLTPPLDDSVYLKLANDTDLDVQRQSAYFNSVGDELRSQILTRLAASPESEILAIVDQQLSKITLAADPTLYLPALESRLFNSRIPIDSDGYDAIRELTRTKIGLQAFATWTIQHKEFSRLEFLRDLLHSGGYDRVLRIDDTALAGLFGLFCERSQPGEYHREKFLQTVKEARPARRAAMRLAMANASFDTATRLIAAELAAEDGGSKFAEAFVALLRDPYWKSHAPNEDDLQTLLKTVNALPPAETNALVLRIVRDKQIPNSLSSVAAIPYSPPGALGREITLAALERWFVPGGDYLGVVGKAIGHLAALPEDASTSLLEAAAFHPKYTEDAIATIITLRRQEDLPILERCLSAEWMPNEHERVEVRREAARGLSSFQSDEAAELLLRGFSSPDSTMRGICMSGLDHIESVRRRTAQWANLKKERPSKQSALAELLVMIDDENIEVRAQAIRGIATFGAVEYLPTLIRLLRDKNTEVVQAARWAIDALSATASSQREG